MFVTHRTNYNESLLQDTAKFSFSKDNLLWYAMSKEKEGS